MKAVLSEALDSDFWQGMPERILPLTLCWQLVGAHRRRREPTLPDQPPSPPLFPSWTWAGWDAKVELLSFLAIKDYESDGEWFVINEQGVATHLDTRPRFPSAHKPVPLTEDILEEILPDRVERDDVDAEAVEWRDARILACWTTVAWFTVDGSTHVLGDREDARFWPRSAVYCIKDAQGVTAGCILLPKSYFEKRTKSRTRFEFMLVARTKRSKGPGRPGSRCYYDESVYGEKYWIMNAMFIARKRGGRAERVGVGVIHEDAWIAAGPESAFVRLI